MSNIGEYDKAMIDFVLGKIDEAEDAGKSTDRLTYLLDGLYDGDQTVIEIVSSWMLKVEADAFSNF